MRVGDHTDHTQKKKCAWMHAGARGGVDEDLVGPAPPELIEEMDAVPEDAREAEVRDIGRGSHKTP